MWRDRNLRGERPPRPGPHGLRKLVELVVSGWTRGGSTTPGHGDPRRPAQGSVEDQLALVPRPSPSESPSPSPVEEVDEGGGEGKPDKDKGKGNGGDEGHGNDD